MDADRGSPRRESARSSDCWRGPDGCGAPETSSRLRGVFRFGPPDPEPLWFDNDDTSAEVLERVRARQPFDQGEDGIRILGNRAENDDPTVAARRIAPQVADPTVEGEQHPAFIAGGRHDHGVALSSQVLIHHGVYVVTLAAEHLR